MMTDKNTPDWLPPTEDPAVEALLWLLVMHGVANALPPSQQQRDAADQTVHWARTFVALVRDMEPEKAQAREGEEER